MAFKRYYQLAKPGIVYGNLMTVAAGFLLASKWHVKFGLLAATLIGMGLVMASACVFNNYIDREIDKKMARTKKRALVTKVISGRKALIYASALGVVGFLTLGLGSTWLVFSLALGALVFYVVIYGYAK